MILLLPHNSWTIKKKEERDTNIFISITLKLDLIKPHPPFPTPWHIPAHQCFFSVKNFCYFSFREHEERMIFKARRRNGMKHFIQTSSPLYNTLIVKHLFVNIPSQKFPYNEMRKTITVIAFSFIRFHFSFRMHHKVPHSPKPFTNR